MAFTRRRDRAPRTVRLKPDTTQAPDYRLLENPSNKDLPEARSLEPEVYFLTGFSAGPWLLALGSREGGVATSGE